MASTNKTTNYELSQYVGTDKPTYLGDYNGDMLKIDTAIHNNATAISGIGGDIDIIEGNVGTLSNLTTTDKSSLVNAINEVDSNSDSNATNIGTLSNLETTNKSTIVNAINEVVEKFNLSNIKTYDSSNITKSGPIASGSISGTFTIATNNDGSIFKFYSNGGVLMDYNGTAGVNTLTLVTDIRPSSTITISGGWKAYQDNGRNPFWLGGISFTIDTSGNLTITFDKDLGAAQTQFFYFPPCIYFAKDFGDVPAPTPNA